MFENLKYIELSEKKYPIKCDLLVLEQIQENYDSIDAFEKGLITWEFEKDESGKVKKDEKGEMKIKGKFPQVKTVMDALYMMVNEGEAIAAELENRPVEILSKEKLARIADLPLMDLAKQLHDEFYRCFASKNKKATENQET